MAALRSSYRSSSLMLAPHCSDLEVQACTIFSYLASFHDVLMVRLLMFYTIF
jgi:hypothetical protein